MRLTQLARRAGFAVGGALALALVTAPAAVAQDTGTVYVVHGVPDTPVDVYVDGQRAIDNFEPGTNQGPVELPAGPHEVALFAADAADGSGTPVLEANADLPAGGNVTLVAHLDASGNPKITPFVNDVSSVPAGQARLVVRHTAAAPTVDVLAGGKPVIEGLSNGQEKALEVPAGSVSAAVAAAGTTDPVIGPADVNLQEGTATSCTRSASSTAASSASSRSPCRTCTARRPACRRVHRPGLRPTAACRRWLLMSTVAGLAVVAASATRLRSAARR